MAWWCFVHLSDWKIDTATLSPSNWTSFDDIWHRGFLYPQIIHFSRFFHYKPDMLGPISGNLHMNIHPTARPCGTWSSLKRSVCSWQTSCVTGWVTVVLPRVPPNICQHLSNIYPTSAIHNMCSWSFWIVRPCNQTWRVSAPQTILTGIIPYPAWYISLREKRLETRAIWEQHWAICAAMDVEDICWKMLKVYQGSFLLPQLQRNELLFGSNLV
jgi:hypothetical protein